MKSFCKSITQILLLFFSIISVSCAYNVGQKFRSLPGGYQKLALPVLKNKSFEPGVEAIMTQALKEEFHRSTVLQVVNQVDSQVVLEGEIEAINTEWKSNTAADSSNYLPKGTVLGTTYNLTMLVSLRLMKTNSSKILWQSQFSISRPVKTAQVTIAGVNSVNSIYNQSAKQQILELMATELSNQIHSNLTEQF